MPVQGVPGPWVEARGSRWEGIHACLPDDLPYWLDAELWRTELAGTIEEVPLQLVAQRGRLVGRVDRWDADMATRFAEDCAMRLRDRAVTHLQAGGLAEAAVALSRAVDSAALVQVTSSLAAGVPGIGSILVAFVGDAAGAALAGSAAGASYVAARALDRTGGGPAAFAAERTVQARWLERKLAL